MKKIKTKKIKELKCPYCDSYHVKTMDEDIYDLYICENCNKDFIFKDNYVTYYKEKPAIILKKAVLKHIKKIILTALILLFILLCYKGIEYFGPGIKKYFSTPTTTTNSVSINKQNKNKIEQKSIKSNIENKNTVNSSNNINSLPNTTFKAALQLCSSALKLILEFSICLNILSLIIKGFYYISCGGPEERNEIKSKMVVILLMSIMLASIDLFTSSFYNIITGVLII